MSKQKILIVDNITHQVEEFSTILSTLSEFDITNSVKYEDSISFFDNNNYEYIIMDHSCKGSDDFLEYVLTKSPQQKFILLSDSLNCPITCDTCINTFNFVRLLKPVKLIEVFNYIKNIIAFECPNKNRFENIDSIEKLETLIDISEYTFYKGKEILDGCLYFRPLSGKNMNINEMDKIKDLINGDFFEIDIKEDFCIKVQKKS